MDFAKKLHSLDEYDICKLKEAKDIIEKIYFYHYGDSYMRSEINRLETILNKLNYLIDNYKKD